MATVHALEDEWVNDFVEEGTATPAAVNLSWQSSAAWLHSMFRPVLPYFNKHEKLCDTRKETDLLLLLLQGFYLFEFPLYAVNPWLDIHVQFQCFHFLFDFLLFLNFLQLCWCGMFALEIISAQNECQTPKMTKGIPVAASLQSVESSSTFYEESEWLWCPFSCLSSHTWCHCCCWYYCHHWKELKLLVCFLPCASFPVFFSSHGKSFECPSVPAEFKG